MKILNIVLVMLIILALLASVGIAKNDFSIKEYINGFSEIGEAPPLPNYNFGDGSFFEQTKNFFVFVGGILSYPVKTLVYLGRVVYHIFGGVVV